MHPHILPSLMLLLCSTFSLTAAQNLPPANLVGVESATVETSGGGLGNGLKGARPEALSATGGSGCKAGTVSTNFNGDRTVLTLIFNDFVADLGPGIPAARNRRFCSVNLKMKIPAGWTFQVSTVDWRGYFDLDRGVRGALGSTYFWSSNKNNKTSIHKVVEGPAHDSYLKHKDGERDQVIWVPCTTKDNVLNVNTAVRLSTAGQSSNTAKGSITVDSIDGRFKQVLNLGWKKC